MLLKRIRTNNNTNININSNTSRGSTCANPWLFCVPCFGVILEPALWRRSSIWTSSVSFGFRWDLYNSYFSFRFRLVVEDASNKRQYAWQKPTPRVLHMDWRALNSILFVKGFCVYVCSYQVWFRHSFRQRFLCLCLQLPNLVPTLISSKVSVFMVAATKFGSDTNFVRGFCVHVCSYQFWFRH